MFDCQIFSEDQLFICENYLQLSYQVVNTFRFFCTEIKGGVKQNNFEKTPLPLKK